MKCKVQNTKSYKLDCSFELTLGVFYALFILIFLSSCNSENAPDCLQNAGETIKIQVDVSDFTNITVFENLNLVLIQGDEQAVEIESGEFLIDEISVEVEGNRLILRNENGCNLFRDYGLSTVYVTSPNIEEVRSSTGLTITSQGTLNYPNLRLISESFNVPEAETTSGTFDLEVDNESVSVVVNGISYYNLRGTTQNLTVTIAAGDTRVEADGLMAENISLNHRGSNDILVDPQQQISGIIRGYGDVICVNRPPEVDVEETFEGRLIFRD